MSLLRPLHNARQTLRDGLTNESLRVAILLGLATIPFTLFLSWESIGSEANASASALFVAGLCAGYYYSDRETTRRCAGIWTGLAGSIGVVILTVADTAAQVVRFGPDWTTMDALLLTLTPVFIAISVGVSVLVVMIGTWIGDWVGRRLDGDRD
ncbi:DUF5518 domain-containing protein [Natronolimnohabitans sp. A-GB9]|uniref:DUF5518 domain-containing protein n=1 Tax=Natronolimnohabitans sp. A-GB9 TaxID=3069757 RepID=UPI0027B2C99F|nr:DUF5518 domain-containing protein [Natronolimnohabitans sp. A-GB9]MDQ2050511.1 DUF5518 domain-containing protein [Natronolimnohabitans sp. A-GB9]